MQPEVNKFNKKKKRWRVYGRRIWVRRVGNCPPGLGRSTLSQQEGADFDLFLPPTLLLVHPVLASFLRYWSPSMNLPLGTQKNVLFKRKNMKDRKNLWSSQSLYF